MFRGVTSKLTKATGEKVDGSRMTEFFMQTHRFTSREVKQMTVITVAATLSGFLGWNLKTRYPNWAVALMFGVFGFGLAHTLTAFPQIQRRRKLESECLSLIAGINQQEIEHDFSIEKKAKVDAVVDLIKNKTLSLGNGNSAPITITWIMRKSMLTDLLTKISNPQDDTLNWEDDEPQAILNALEDTKHITFKR